MQTEPVDHAYVGKAKLRHGGSIRQNRRPNISRRSQRAQLAIFDQRSERGSVTEYRLYVSAYHVRDGEACPTIRHMNH